MEVGGGGSCVHNNDGVEVVADTGPDMDIGTRAGVAVDGGKEQDAVVEGRS